MTKEQVKRLNEIPHEIMRYKKDLKYAKTMNWHTAAAMMKKNIADLEAEFKEIYNSL